MGKYRSKMICMVAVVFFIILIGGGSVTAAGFAGGSGTIADPYLISTAQQLDAVRSNLSAHYKLTNDIDLSGYSNWEPIGSQTAEFVGSLDGDGYTIRNLSINRPDEHYVGLFGCIEQDASFKDIKIIVGDKGIKGIRRVGALIGGTGFAAGKIKIEGCSVEGPGIIEGYGDVGGLVGNFNPRGSVASVISNCKSAVDVSATSYGSGGLIGSLMYGTVTDSFATGNVICMKNQSGGLIGTVKGLVTVSKCYATGHASGYRAGGLVGGFSGGRGSNITIENSFALGEAESIDAAGSSGGILGFAAISDSSCKVTIENCYAAVQLKGNTSKKGGMFGERYGSRGVINVINCYTDGIVMKWICTDHYQAGISRLTTGMKRQMTFEGWDFTNVWGIDENQTYPYLKPLDKPIEVVVGQTNDVAGGSGTIADPYLIGTAEQLYNMRYDLSAHYKLTNDIDLSGYSNWEPIGNQNAEFMGSLDGDGHTIRDLSINRPDEHYVGLFGCIEQDASFKDIKIIVGDKGIKGISCVGALIGGTGFAAGNIKIEGCSVEGSGIIEGYGNVGGLVGNFNPRGSVAGVISNCKSAVNVSATSYGSGGLIGSLMHGTVTDSFATGNVICTKNQSGGLIGTVKGLVTVSKCYATGHASGYRAGGLVGGFSGGSGSNITIENSFALGEAESIDTTGSSGGILGFAAISDSSCKVTIENCYAAVHLKGNTSKKGGIFGERYGGRGVINVINCYYNADLNPELSPSSYNIPKTTSELKSIDTFSTWDIVESIDNTKIWNMKSGLSYPWLAKIPRPLTPDFPAPVPVTGVSLNKERITLNIGKEGSFEAETLAATIYPSDADNKMLLWTSGNPEVARVDENGKVSAVAEGTAIITVTTEDGGYTDTCDVVVEFVPPVISFMPNGSMQPQQTISTTVTIEGYVERNSLQGIWSAEADPAKITNWEDIGGLFGSDMNAATVTLSNTDGEYYYHVKGVNVLGEDVAARTEKFVVGQSFIDAFNAVESAELSTIQGDVDSAWIYVNNLPESESKILLRDRLNAVQYIIDSRPGIPENISISATSDQIILVYSAVNNATRYEIEVDGEIINNGSNLTYTHSNLLPNQQHSYRIRALNEYGAGSWSEQLTISTILKAPGNLSAKSTNKSITITWEATEGAEEYDVEANGIVVGSTSATSFVHSTLIPDREYAYRVRSKKSGYVSDWSSELIQRTSVNHSPVLAIIGDKSVQAGDSLKFTVHATDIDNDTLIYRADNLPDGAAFDSATAAFVWTPDNTQTGTYEGIHFEVTDGFTTVSEKMTITVNPSPISVPQNVYGIPSYNSITVTWDEVPNTTGYEIEADGSSQTVAETVYTHTDLLPGTQHYYRVRAFNIEMVSEWSNVITVSTAVYHNMLEVPRNLVAELEGTGIRLTWDQVAGASSYDINADGKLRTVTEAVYLHEGLQPNTQYTYRVRAKSAAGMSDWSEVLTVSIPQTAGGSGTIEDPYLIGTAEQLYNIRYDLAAHYKIINDIDLSDYTNWEPIGSGNTPFTGSLDGDNYIIKNLNIHRDDDYVGLFSYIENVVLKNIKIELGEKGITGDSRTGALVGYGKSSTMENCSVAGPGKVHGNIYVGGLIGEIESSTITGCSSAIRVESTRGINGGLIGQLIDSNLARSYTTGAVLSQSGGAGGLVGSLSIYRTEEDCTVEESYATGKVTGSNGVGGLIGYAGINIINTRVIKNCFAIGDVEVTSPTGMGGGLIGYVGGNKINRYLKIINCYAAGKVAADAGNERAKGLAQTGNYAEMINCYYDGITSGVGDSYDSRLTSGLKKQSTFTDWDFMDVWMIEEDNSYPYLKILPQPAGVIVGSANDVKGGSGMIQDPYLIGTAEQLYNIRYDLTAHYKITNDIDLRDYVDWEPIGSRSVPFAGALDGDNYVIKNLNIHRDDDYTGLFSCIENVVLKNIKIELGEKGIMGDSRTGALVGYGKSSTMENCSVVGPGKVHGNIHVGGLIGEIESSTITGCSSAVRVESTRGIGGGLIGLLIDSNLARSYTTGAVLSQSGGAGGLVGSLSIYRTGEDCIVEESYATGKVTGSSGVGGLIGGASINIINTRVIKNCFAIGDIEVTSPTGMGGGLIGYGKGHGDNSQLKIINCYAAGRVVADAGNERVKGLAQTGNYTAITHCFYNKDINPGSNYENPSGSAKTTAELKAIDTFTNWDITAGMDETKIWNIEDGESYPWLSSLPIPQGDHFPLVIEFDEITITESSIGLSWKEVEGYDRYDIEADGIVVDNGTSTTYVHHDLMPGTLHTYRIRAKNNEGISKWSATFTMCTLYAKPENLLATATENTVTLTWDRVAGAAEYEIEANGTIIDRVADATYIHTGLTSNTQYIYRIRAKNNITKSHWSDIAAAITWTESSPGLCIAAANWVTQDDTEKEVEILIKTNHFNEMYTAHAELKYDPASLALKADSIKRLIWPQDQNVYVSNVEDTQTGSIKFLISQTGSVQGETGQFDVLSIKFNIITNDPVQIKALLAKVVDASGEYIHIPAVSDLNIKVLNAN